mgnify:FL=1
MATGHLTRQLAENIAVKRKEMGLTQAQIAERIAVEKETISRMESGKVAITLDRVEQFAKIFHCAAIDLLRDSSEDFLLQAESIADLIRPLSQKERELVIKFISETVQLFSMCKERA